MIVNGFIAEMNGPGEKMAGYDLGMKPIGRADRLSLMISQLNQNKSGVEAPLMFFNNRIRTPRLRSPAHEDGGLSIHWTMEIL